MEGPAWGPGSPRRANPLRKASGSCLSLASVAVGVRLGVVLVGR